MTRLDVCGCYSVHLVLASCHCFVFSVPWWCLWAQDLGRYEEFSLEEVITSVRGCLYSALILILEEILSMCKNCKGIGIYLIKHYNLPQLGCNFKA